MGLNEWLEDYLNDESLREVFDDRKWNKIIAHESGRLEGVEEGALQKQQEMALKMLSYNKPIEEITLFTGLTEEEINNLSKEKN